MKRRDNIERFLLKSLIADLDVAQEELEFDPTEEAKTATCTPKSLFNDSNNEEKCIEESMSNTPLSQSLQSPICYEEILASLSNQKTTLTIQTKVRNLNPIDLSLLLVELEGKLSSLMKDKNGNYLCSDIFKVCTINQRLAIIKEIEPQIVDISIHQFGTHPIQTLIELSKTNEEIDSLIKLISAQDALINISKNANGSYVIQKIISNIPDHRRLLFNNALLDNLVILSLDMYGVCIIKKYLTQSLTFLYFSIPIITKNFLLIAQNQYGNYLIQYLLELYWNRTEIIPIKQMVINCFVVLSSDRFASHITEKFVTMLSAMDKQILLSTLIRSGCSNVLFNDKFGMYVMNKLTGVSAVTGVVANTQHLNH